MLQQEITKSLKMSEKMKISEKKKNYKIDLNEASEIRTTERTQIWVYTIDWPPHKFLYVKFDDWNRKYNTIWHSRQLHLKVKKIKKLKWKQDFHMSLKTVKGWPVDSCHIGILNTQSKYTHTCKLRKSESKLDSCTISMSTIERSIKGIFDLRISLHYLLQPNVNLH